MSTRRGTQSRAGEEEFFRQLYEGKAEYVARREDRSFEARLVRLEVDCFKVPNLVAALPPGFEYSTVVEIGCATGELLAAFPAPSGARKIGFDISRANVLCAAARHPGIDFHVADFRSFEGRADLVILSDVLEHVSDDRGMLSDAAAMARLVLVNLPLEDNWLNARRAYGPDDVSGHLRRYTLAEGLALIEAAGLHVLQWHRRWIHETDCDLQRRNLRQDVLGTQFSGGVVTNAAKRSLCATARWIRPFGRRLFASNLFAGAAVRIPP